MVKGLQKQEESQVQFAPSQTTDAFDIDLVVMKLVINSVPNILFYQTSPNSKSAEPGSGRPSWHTLG